MVIIVVEIDDIPIRMANACITLTTRQTDWYEVTGMTYDATNE